MRRYRKRTPEDQIAALEAKIASIKNRAERRKAKANPAVRLTLAAIRSCDKAMSATDDTTMRAALQEARSTLAACVALDGVVVPASGAANTSKPPKRRRLAGAAA